MQRTVHGPSTVLHVKWLPGDFVQYGRHGGQDRDAEYGRSASSREIVAVIEHVLSDKLGEWRVSIVEAHANDNWEMKVEGPEGFERSYTLVGGTGEHQPNGDREGAR